MAITIGNTGTPGATTLPAASQSQGGAPQQAATRAVVAKSESAPRQQPRPEQLQQAMEMIKQSIEAKAPNSLEFSVDDSTGKTIVMITDAETGEMIRQIPSEEMVAIARSLDKLQEGMLLQQQA